MWLRSNCLNLYYLLGKDLFVFAAVHLVYSVAFTKLKSKEQVCQYDLESNKHKKHNGSHAEASSSVFTHFLVEKTHETKVKREHKHI